MQFTLGFQQLFINNVFILKNKKIFRCEISEYECLVNKCKEMLTDYAFSWRKSSGEAATFPSKKPFFCTISAIMSRKWYATDPIRCNIYIYCIAVMVQFASGKSRWSPGRECLAARVPPCFCRGSGRRRRGIGWARVLDRAGAAPPRGQCRTLVQGLGR